MLLSNFSVQEVSVSSQVLEVEMRNGNATKINPYNNLLPGKRHTHNNH